MLEEGLNEDEIIRRLMSSNLPEGVKPFNGSEVLARLTVQKQKKKKAA